MNVQTESRRLLCRLRRLLLTALVVGLGLTNHANLEAQSSSGNMYDYGLPPGEIAFRKSLARQSMVGYFQPVRIVGPAGATVEVFSQDSFADANETRVAGMMVGHVYRLKITNIPGYPGKELYPSVEIIGRLYPPQGKESRFPIPVNIGLPDLEPAMAGNLVTRVVYLENPRNTIAEQRTPDDQPFFDVAPGQDPIHVAEKFGRPMVIVRIGSRIPDANELNLFGFGAPPLQWFPVSSQQPATSPNNDASSDGEQTRVNSGSSVQQTAFAQPAPQETVCCPPGAATGGYAYPSPQSLPPIHLPPWPDELLIDGGDRSTQAHVRDTGNAWEIRGLDTEDTVAHFDTLDGRRIVDASNRVAIYSPRFSAIRKIDQLGRTQYTNMLGSTTEGIAPSTSQRTDISSTTLQNLQPIRHKRSTVASGVENRTRGVPLENGTQMRMFQSTFKTYENLRLIRTGFVDNREKGRLAISMEKALSWASDMEVQSTTRGLFVIIAEDVQETKEAVHVKTEKGRPQIRLVKVASTDAALPGEFVDFTIRFDNVGNQPIGNVTIVDNLTARLAYVDGTAECSVPGDFVTEPNKAGSQVLRWELTDPLQPAKGGVIRFRCQVR